MKKIREAERIALMNRACFMGIISMLIFGTIGIFRRFIPISSELLAFSRGVLGALYLLGFIVITKRKKERLSGRCLVELIITGALIGFNWIFLFESYNYTTVSVATMCYYMQPTIVILLSPVFLGEKLTAKKVVSALLSMTGMFLISGIMEGRGISSTDGKGILFGLGAAVLYASVIILNKKTKVEDIYLKTMIELFAASFTIAPYILLSGSVTAVALTFQSVVMIFVVGIVHTGIAYAMYFASLDGISAQTAAVISYIDPVTALILSALVLGESLTLYGVIGALLIIGSSIMSELETKRGHSA